MRPLSSPPGGDWARDISRRALPLPWMPWWRRAIPPGQAHPGSCRVRRPSPQEIASAANDVAKSAVGALNPEAFWLAWRRGAQMAADTFAADGDLRAVVRAPVGDLRRRYAIPSLDPSADATLALLGPASGPAS